MPAITDTSMSDYTDQYLHRMTPFQWAGTPLKALHAEVVAAAAEKGLAVYRYERRLGKFDVSIHYAAHPAADVPEPNIAMACNGPRVELHHAEGTTQRCEAWRQLNVLLALIRRLDSPTQPLAA